ncbi:hypothetical protein BJX96DRAFT_160678 [Aspergillus floccosus]
MLRSILFLGGLSAMDIKCHTDGHLGARKLDLVHAAKFLEETSFFWHYSNGCSTVAAWNASGVYLCHENSETITIDSREIGRLAYEGINACSTTVFVAEVHTSQHITVRLAKPS